MTPDSPPFGDQFVEEEVVIDRYAALDAELFAGRPTVSSVEGHSLGQSLAAVARDLDLAASKTSRNTSTPNASAAAVENYTSTFEIGAGEVVRPFVGATPRSPSADGSRADGDAIPAPRGQTADPFDDSDLIVIEDDPAPATTPIRARPEVRRQEYRQLFAKLRRG
jgi:hypothetical protein